MGKKEAVIDEYRKGLHDITVAGSDEEIDRISEKIQDLITDNSELFSAKEYADDLATLRIFYWKAKTKMQEGI